MYRSLISEAVTVECLLLSVSLKLEISLSGSPETIIEEASRSLVKMPSLQTSLPPELANNVVRLYRECLRRAKFIGKQQHNTELVVGMVRQQFKKHMNETDPEKIQKLKDDAARGLINHMLFESAKLTGGKVSQRS